MRAITVEVKLVVNDAKNTASSVKRTCQELGEKSASMVIENTDIDAAVCYGVEKFSVSKRPS